ncbi:MAG: DNA-3-methyladenine glycosylase 2 family protein [Acidobacteria bacterium]|nr:DNA-3-methyladenine glycosylase 2 family protein [Acidobacteriota bacterium]
MGETLGLSVRALDRARMSRDARFDGKFFIAITSTRIYCRPICPSPHAKRPHVRYYPSAAAAAAAGYRPCLRCRPEAAPGTPAWLGTSAVVRRALRLIDAGFLDHNSIDELAARLGIGSRHLHRLFLRHVGAPPVAMAQTRRLHFAKRLVDETQLPITQIAFAAGFESIRRFNSAFRQTFRRAPRELRRQRSAIRGDEDEVVLRLAFRPPYDWAQVRDFLAHRAVPGIELASECRYVRTARVGRSAALISVYPAEGENALELRVRDAEPAALLHISANARRTFDVASDPALVAAAFRYDPLLAPLVHRHPGLRIAGAWDAFECAVLAVLSQQIGAAEARRLTARLVVRAGCSLDTSTARVKHLFPTPAELAEANLEGLGLTVPQLKALRALAWVVAERKLDFEAAAADICATLVALPGIGEWTAQYIALRALGEPDAFPASDRVLRTVAAGGRAPLSASELEMRAEAWRPWRGYAAMHLWRAAMDRS